jgi:hypothetical protein
MAPSRAKNLPPCYQLEHRGAARPAGGCLYTPDGVPQVAASRGATTVDVAGASTNPNEQASVPIHRERDARIP